MIACGNFQIFSRAQGVDSIHPGDGPGRGAAAGESPALSPRCAQIPEWFAQVIHNFVHRAAWLAPGRRPGKHLPRRQRQRTWAQVTGSRPRRRVVTRPGRLAVAVRDKACLGWFQVPAQRARPASRLGPGGQHLRSACVILRDYRTQKSALARGEARLRSTANLPHSCCRTYLRRGICLDRQATDIESGKSPACIIEI
jgi:hypothetical protein